MSGDVLRFAKSPHRAVQELLPWFVTGALGAEEERLVAQHLQTCAVCRAERDGLELFHGQYVGRDAPTDTERLLETMRERLSAEAPAHPKTRERSSTGLPGAWMVRHLTWMKVAIAVQFAVIFVLGWEVIRTEPERAGYRTLGSGSTPARAAGDLVAVFDPNTPQREVARILRQSGVRVVDGPTASNGYVLSADGGLQAALDRLHAEPAVVLVQPLQAGAAP